LRYGLLNENLFNFALANLLFNVNHGDVVEKWEINDTRHKLLWKVEALLRNAMKKLAFEEEMERMVAENAEKDEILAFSKSFIEPNDFE
jgi:hypothetical protein